MNFAPLDNASTALTDAADHYKKALAAASGIAGNRAAVQAVNARLIQTEREFLDPKGLEHRSWYRHLLYAPGFYTGYGVKTLPGVRESIEQREYSNVEPEVQRAAAAIKRVADTIEAAAAELEKAR